MLIVRSSSKMRPDRRAETAICGFFRRDLVAVKRFAHDAAIFQFDGGERLPFTT